MIGNRSFLVVPFLQSPCQRAKTLRFLGNTAANSVTADRIRTYCYGLMRKRMRTRQLGTLAEMLQSRELATQILVGRLGIYFQRPAPMLARLTPITR